MKVAPVPAVLVALATLTLPACQPHKEEEGHHEHHKIVATSPMSKDVVVTQQYVCQIRARKNIEIRALQEGYLEPITLKEGQTVKAQDVLFKVVPTLYQTRLDTEMAEVQQAELELQFTQNLAGGDKPVVSQNEVAIQKTKLARAKAKAAQAETELNFCVVRAPFDGIVDRLNQQQGSLVKKDEVLTTLSDNSTMWVYFNVPETRYLEYMAGQGKGSKAKTDKAKKDDDADDHDHKKDKKDDHKKDDHKKDKDDEKKVKGGDDDDDKGNVRGYERIELVLANGMKYPYTGKLGAVEAKFNNETGNIPFRADFPNPDRLLRHGQTGNVLIHRAVRNAVVIPQRATYEILDRRYVYVLDAHDEIHQREIVVQYELDDVFVIQKGVNVGDRIVLEGGRPGLDGQHAAEVEFRKPEDALAHQKQPAE